MLELFVSENNGDSWEQNTFVSFPPGAMGAIRLEAMWAGAGSPKFLLVEISNLPNHFTSSSNLAGARANTKPSRTAKQPKIVKISAITTQRPILYQSLNSQKIRCPETL